MLPLLRVLFLGTGNSPRSQMAEAWTREEDALAAYRRVCDDIRALVDTLPGRSRRPARRVLDWIQNADSNLPGTGPGGPSHGR